jgi:hypothetical protein
MRLIEAWQDAAIREGFALERPIKTVAAETGLSTLEVFQRQLALNLVPSGSLREPIMGTPKREQDRVPASTVAPVTKPR